MIVSRERYPVTFQEQSNSKSCARHFNSEKNCEGASRKKKMWSGEERYIRVVCYVYVSDYFERRSTREPKGIQYSVRTRYTTRSTRARVLMRIRPRVFAPYDASTCPASSPDTHILSLEREKERERQLECVLLVITMINCTRETHWRHLPLADFTELIRRNPVLCFPLTLIPRSVPWAFIAVYLIDQYY